MRAAINATRKKIHVHTNALQPKKEPRSRGDQAFDDGTELPSVICCRRSHAARSPAAGWTLGCLPSAATASAAARPRRSPHKLQMRPAQFHPRTFTRNLPTKPSHEIFTRKRNLRRNEQGDLRARRSDNAMRSARRLAIWTRGRVFGTAPVARAARRLPSLPRTPQGEHLAASRAGRSLNPPRSLG